MPRLVPAAQFTIEELTNAYNQTRVDYLIPMPMTPARLADYVKIYDVDMAHSWAAVDEQGITGIAMLGVRPGRTWVTRLGVVPGQRRAGTGETLLNALVESTRALGSPLSILEVIQGNQPAQRLFLKTGFRPTRELLVLRRPPAAPPEEPAGAPRWLSGEEALAHLHRHPTRLPWTNEVETYLNARGVEGLEVNLGAAGSGRVIYRRQPSLLSHFVFQSEAGQSPAVCETLLAEALLAEALLAHLYRRYPAFETHAENIPADDPHLEALFAAGFYEDFRRMEMLRENP